MSPGVDERRLDDVVGGDGVAKEPESEVIDAIGMPLEEGAKGFGVAFEDTRSELVV